MSRPALQSKASFENIRPVRPRIVLIVGGHENVALRDSNEIRLVDWDPHLFAQGVVALVFDAEVDERRTLVSKRAFIGATSVVDARALTKRPPLTVRMPQGRSFEVANRMA